MQRRSTNDNPTLEILKAHDAIVFKSRRNDALQKS